MAHAAPSRSEKLGIPVTPDELGLIARAAKITGKSRSKFVLDAACQAAEEILLDRIRRADAP